MDQPRDTSPTVNRTRLSVAHAAHLLRLGAEPDAGTEPARATLEAPWLGGTASADTAGRPIAGIHGPIGRAGARITLLVVASASFLAIGTQESVRNPPNRSMADGSVSRSLRPASRATPGDPGAGQPNSETRSMQKQFMGVAALGAALAVADASHAQAVQWRVEHGGNGHWYQREGEPLEWPEARNRAAERGGHLISIRSQAEYAFIQRSIQIQSDLFWTGGYQEPGACEPGCGWKWVTGEPWDYTNWNSNEPSDSYGIEHWMECYPGGLWNDRGPGPLVSVVEWSADCNGDGIVDYGQCRDGSLPDYNGNNIPDCCESGTPCVVGNYPVQWRVEDGGNGHWYRFVDGTATWMNASAAAAAGGAHLATITSAGEQGIARSVLQGRCAWIGARRVSASMDCHEGWNWVTGEPFTFADWYPGEPNGCAFNPPYTDQAACINWCWHSAGQWNDMPIDWTNCMQGSLYEWSADCNNDGLVDYGQILQGQLADTNQNGVPDSCETPDCTSADLFRDFNVNGADLGILLAQWGAVTPLTVSDLNRDGAVDGIDLGLLLSFWGPCPG